MDRRHATRAVIALGAFARFAELRAQPAVQKTHRIGFLAMRPRPSATEPDPAYDAFSQAIRDLGYQEGKNIIIDRYFAHGDYERLNQFAAQLVQAQAEVIVAAGNPAIVAAQRATNTVPIVMTTSIDPVRQGFVSSLARPGANITGLTNLVVDLSSKQIEVLSRIVPTLSHVAVLANPNNPNEPYILKGLKAAAQARAIEVSPIHARSVQDIERAFASMEPQRTSAVIVGADASLRAQAKEIAALALQHRVVTLGQQREYARAGGLISYGYSAIENYRRAAVYVDKILKGAKPADLPVEQPSDIQLTINRKTANSLHITIPNELLLRADEVIE